ncbi:MAG: type II/IV secretion system ATPase subunit [Candidatus Aenigmatarchaeota archaeon]
MEKVLESYKVVSEGIEAKVSVKRTNDFVFNYELDFPEIERGTQALLEKVRSLLLTEMPVRVSEISDLASMEQTKKKFMEKGLEILKKQMPFLDEKTQKYLIGFLMQEMFGLGKIEFLLSDPNLEEVVINGSKDFVWVYHKKYGWLKTNLKIENENEILNYANNIGRKVGRQITVLNPLMDAHLPTGDRVNATLFPISTCGNTITIRKFRRSPWTIVDFIENKTLNFEVTSWIWLAIQYELNMIIAGGTASGKTSLLNVFMSFIPANHRLVSIEDTRELKLADFLHWVPLTTREPNPEGLGGVKMLDLLVNSLRMRPDRIIVGEIRRSEEAEVLFEAMHTGHSVYATLHADTAEQALKRLINPPINVPETVIEALHLIAVAFRDRRTGLRRLFQLAEILPTEKGVKINTLFRWKPVKDEIVKEKESFRVLEEIRMHTGMTDQEIERDLKEKEEILKWLVKRSVKDVNKIGRVVAIYYLKPEYILKAAEKNEDVDKTIEKWYS